MTLQHRGIGMVFPLALGLDEPSYCILMHDNKLAKINVIATRK